MDKQLSFKMKIVVGFFGIFILFGMFFVGFQVGQGHRLDICLQDFGNAPLPPHLRLPFPGNFGANNETKRFGAKGTIVALEKESFTLRDDENIDKVVMLTPKTIIRDEAVQKENAQLHVNDTVVVLGQTNPKGEFMARMIKIEKN